MIAKTYSLIFFLADAIAPVKAGKYMPESLVSLSKDASSTKSIGSSERKEFSSLNDRRKGRGNRSLQGTLPSGVTDCDASIGRTGSSVAYRSASTSLYEPFEPIFCMNDGFCKSSYKLNPDNPCECVEGYAGPHCEFVGTEADVPSNCTLECQNDSTCKIGAQSWTSMLHYQFADVRPENIQYCSCSAGFFGPFCEYNVNDDNSVICGGKPCFNGGTCVETVDEVGIKSSHCDCTTADIGGVLHAGTYCENEATTQCSDDGNGRQFCVNGGTCKGDS